MKRFLLTLTCLMVLGACKEEHVPPVEYDTAGTKCGAAKLQYLVGQNQDRITDLPLKTPLRQIGPKQPVTLDYRAERLNIEHDEHNIIRRVFCG